MHPPILGRTLSWLFHLECRLLPSLKFLLQCQLLRQVSLWASPKQSPSNSHSFSRLKALAPSRNYLVYIYACLL